ncbi:MAG TPA: type III toxin-antitoxin system ToxN/AbiQ family toxin [Clostridiales bacterium]|nr:type III toxin-antitoxin system ToxN/AbiQ family toxin [Clostridiales bacterium]
MVNRGKSKKISEHIEEMKKVGYTRGHYFRGAEIQKRGFTKIPDIIYNTNEKFVCGVVLHINEFEYYAPISSFKVKQQSNILISELATGKVLSSIRFSFMFPVDPSNVNIKDFSKETSRQQDLLNKEYIFCNNNRELIYSKAKQIYNKVYNGFDVYFNRNCCDFKLLEHKCREYFVNYIHVRYFFRNPFFIFFILFCIIFFNIWYSF